MKQLLFCLAFLVVFTGCARGEVPPATPPVAATQPAPPLLESTATFTATAPPARASIWLSRYLPKALVESFHLPSGMDFASSAEVASLQLSVGEGLPVSSWTYALAAPFPTLSDETTLQALQNLWLHGSAIGEEGQRLLVDASTLGVFSTLWGQPSSAVQMLESSALLDTAWRERTTWAILPFETLEPRWKVIALDGQSPLHKDFDPRGYGLQVQFSLAGDARQAAPLLAALPDGLALKSNRRADRLTTVILTGTTSLVRATAALMELHGMDYPAQDIGDLLRGADILHISNEIAFARNCPSPLPHSGLIFCSQERYIQLLEDIGAKVIDLSGDHLNDWGPEALRYTIDLYHQRGWQTYGGGENIPAGRQPALFEHNGNKIAFLGCNYKAPGYSSASQTEPGAVHCDPAWLEPAIQKLKDQGYLVIVTLQDDEYMEAIARPKLQEDFRSAVDAGAALVSGTQSHQPQAFDFRNGAWIHYGLGNLFFDQIHSWETTDQAFIDRIVIYNGKHISTELITTIFVDFARPRFMTPEERQKLLRLIFKASGW